MYGTLRDYNICVWPQIDILTKACIKHFMKKVHANLDDICKLFSQAKFSLEVH